MRVYPYSYILRKIHCLAHCAKKGCLLCRDMRLCVWSRMTLTGLSVQGVESGICPVYTYTLVVRPVCAGCQVNRESSDERAEDSGNVLRGNVRHGPACPLVPLSRPSAHVFTVMSGRSRVVKGRSGVNRRRFAAAEGLPERCPCANFGDRIVSARGAFWACPLARQRERRGRWGREMCRSES